MPMTLTRSLLTILIPGLIAIAPWLLVVVQHTEATLGFGSYPTLANALVFASAAVAGSLFETIGTFREVAWDKEREEQFSVQENWYAYLARTFDKEPVGYRYISRLVTTMYFELSMTCAVPLFFFGAAVSASLRFSEYSVVFGLAALIAAVAAGYFFHNQAKLSHLVICRTRLQLNARAAV